MNKSFGTTQITRATALPSTRGAGECGRTRLGRGGWRAFGLAFALLGAQAGAAPFAYITNGGSNSVSVIDIATNTLVGGGINVQSAPQGVAVNTVSGEVYVANVGSLSVSVIQNNAVVATIPVGRAPFGVAITPDGKKAFATNFSNNSVTWIDTASRTPGAVPIPTGTSPIGVDVSPNGGAVYVSNFNGASVSVIDAVSNTVGQTIALGAGAFPQGILVSGDSKKVYVALSGTNRVGVIDVQSGTLAATIAVGTNPTDLALNKAGDRLYVSNFGSNTFSVIDTTTNQVIGTQHPTFGNNPRGLALTLDGASLYVANQGSNTVTVIDPQTFLLQKTIPVGAGPIAFGKFISSAVAPPPPNPGDITPQVGLWWNAAESGSGYALDYKKGVLVVTVYSYTTGGAAQWYLASGPVINNQFSATLDRYQNGQCISCSYPGRPTQPGNDGTITITFTSSTTATMTLPGRTVQIVPQPF